MKGKNTLCGIFAVLQTKQIWSESILENALGSLKHRGPDGSGIWSEDGIFLGHRRLAIIDLLSGSQPMFSNDERYVISFNGEIYCYQELRSELERKGHSFITESDTEVIIEAFRRWGIACLEHLDGIFAFVLWDRETKTLFAARDRLGIKPLYWTNGPGYLIFCSTIEPLFQLPKFQRHLNFEALRDVLVFDYIPSPRTIFKNVYKLPPASYVICDYEQTQPEISSYWQIPDESDVYKSFGKAEILERVEFMLDRAVVRQMVSDVPIGAFLSGGIDSSLIVAIMARQNSNPIKTFSISFKGKEYDESSFAKEVSIKFGTEHTVFPAEEITGSKMLDIISLLDEPFADPALIPTYILSKLTREHVTVALSGDGGDEVFGGYPKYLLGEDKRRNPWLPWTRPAKWIVDLIPVHLRGVGRFYWRTLDIKEQIQYSWTTYSNFPVFRKDLRQVINKDVLEQVNVNDFFSSWTNQAKRWGPEYDSNLLMRTDMTTYLSENCLVKTDRMSMLNSLEVRVPYLDELVINEVLPLSSNLKIDGKQLKSLLFAIAKKKLPDCTWNRPKHGFTVPLGFNLGTVWQKEVIDILEWGAAKLPVLNYPYLMQLNKINRQSLQIGRELWNPLVFLVWFSKHYSDITL